MYILRVCTRRRNYTYKERTQEKASHGRTCSPYRQQARPIGRRTGRRTDRRMDRRTYTGYCPVPGRSKSLLSASLALDSYRKMFPTRSPSLVIFLSLSCPPSLPPSLFYSSVCCLWDVESHPVCSARECKAKNALVIMAKNKFKHYMYTAH